LITYFCENRSSCGAIAISSGVFENRNFAMVSRHRVVLICLGFVSLQASAVGTPPGKVSRLNAAITTYPYDSSFSSSLQDLSDRARTFIRCWGLINALFSEETTRSRALYGFYVAYGFSSEKLVRKDSGGHYLDSLDPLEYFYDLLSDLARGNYKDQPFVVDDNGRRCVNDQAVESWKIDFWRFYYTVLTKKPQEILQGQSSDAFYNVLKIDFIALLCSMVQKFEEIHGVRLFTRRRGCLDLQSREECGEFLQRQVNDAVKAHPVSFECETVSPKPYELGLGIFIDHKAGGVLCEKFINACSREVLAREGLCGDFNRFLEADISYQSCLVQMNEAKARGLLR
jgi:hypothetical protein